MEIGILVLIGAVVALFLHRVVLYIQRYPVCNIYPTAVYFP